MIKVKTPDLCALFGAARWNETDMAAESSMPVIQRIAIAGALIDAGSSAGKAVLGPHEQISLYQSLAPLMEAGISLAETPEIYVFNPLYDGIQGDYLLKGPENGADLVLISNVNDGPMTSHLWRRQHREYACSPLWDRRDAWSNAVRRDGPYFVSIYGSRFSNSVCAWHFSGAPELAVLFDADSRAAGAERQKHAIFDMCRRFAASARSEHLPQPGAFETSMGAADSLLMNTGRFSDAELRALHRNANTQSWPGMVLAGMAGKLLAGGHGQTKPEGRLLRDIAIVPCVPPP